MGFFRHGHWEVRTQKGYAFLCCPSMERILTFGQKRQVYKELFSLEKMLEDGYSCWIGYTDITNVHIIRMYSKIGCKPFHYSLEYNILWFKKEF